MKIEYERDELLTEQSQTLLAKHYLFEGETPQAGFARAAKAYSLGDEALAQRIYDYASQGWFMFASPILSNAPREGEKFKGLPISCFLNMVDDSLEGLMEHTTETRWMSVKGGGVGGHWSSVRAVSNKAPGPIPFLRTIDADMLAYSQGGTRRGSYAAYLDVSHPDIEEFLAMRVPTGGDINRKCLNIHHAINITDEFLTAVRFDNNWELICPDSGVVRDTMKARDLWSRILKTRFRTGEPYLNYIDEANRKLPAPLKHLGLKIHGSNLCNEIHLPTDINRSAVCCLSSLNLEYWDEWKGTTIVEDLVRFLDNVLTVFIKEAPDSLSKAIYSAKRERSIGLGAMGFHYYLQRHGFPFGSAKAKQMNDLMFWHIKEKALIESMRLGEERGIYPDAWSEAMLDGQDIAEQRRNAHLLAIAPNANNSLIVGTSPSVEPCSANAYTHRSRIGSYLMKNKYLEKLLEEKGMNTKEVWTDIIANNGSVQDVDFLTDEEKKVFLTADEVDQLDIIDQARIRQKYICQGQSINLFFKPGADPKYVNQVHMRAWSQAEDVPGTPLKGLYYLRTENGSKADKLTEQKERVALVDSPLYEELCNDLEKERQAIECIGCEG
jgi:ribonucleoside-diphosphate reductase alpha chain